MDNENQNPQSNTPTTEQPTSSAPVFIGMSEAQPEPNSNTPSKKRIFGTIALVIALLLALPSYFFLTKNEDKTVSSASSSSNQTFYIPKQTSQMQNPTLVEYENAPTESVLTYTIGTIQFGQGLSKGVHTVTQYEKTDAFSPPESCRLGPGASSAVKCFAYDQSTLSGEVYVYEGQRPGAIQNTSIGSYTTVFALLGDTVVQIESADTSTQDVIDLISSFIAVPASELPETITRSVLEKDKEDTEVIVNQLEWAYVPTYIPAGVNDFHRCGTNRGSSDIFVCTFQIDEYPGFLSDSSYKYLVENYTGSDGEILLILSFTQMTQFPYQKNMEPFLYNDEKCDIQSIYDLAIATDDSSLTASRELESEFSTAAPREGDRCIQVTSPRGRELVYDSFKNYPGSIEIPKLFYFRIDDTITVLHMDRDNSWEAEVTASSLPQADENYLDELLKFIDGFEPVR
ncbi:TPA: hypothetical protein EYO12_02180 [Candidatus Saccharibacteria bacterium]|nr:hypothetical protein [Candidatus Saccharibacteria bacterium]HIO87523.1 hypothetical protein [Candidatus Saccharibacteria bacterium]